MCGLAGFIDRTGGTDAPTLAAIAERMAESLRHRGPDDGAVWTDAEAGVAFGHRRLAVRDLSPTGRQPMASEDGRFILSYNGEIYDADPLRDELRGKGYRFRGTSDTEVLLNACAEWGVAAALDRMNGMFAFALWDRRDRGLTLARDRMGIKPLYWAVAGGLFLFGSELKAMRCHPDWRPEIDPDAVADFMRLSYVPAPKSIWQGAHKLEPGTILTLPSGGAPTVSRYWDMAAVATGARRSISMEDAAEELDGLLRAAVSRRLVADVPLGVFLSGGIDSSAVTAVAQAVGGGRTSTFSVGFAEGAYDESKDAEAVARHLGTDHASLTVTPEDARAVIPDLPRWYDEPFADSSQIPMALVSRFARGKVTVALSGDGGDEVFAGYNRYLWAARHLPRQRRLPLALRRAMAAGAAGLPPGFWNGVGTLMGVDRAGLKVAKAASVLTFDDPDTAYRVLTGAGTGTASAVPGGRASEAVSMPEGLRDPVERMQYRDTLTYLPDDILTKVDRASMAVGLEARVPLLDPAILRFAWSLPPDLKISGGCGKTVLRRVLGRYLPSALFEAKPKAGFAVPIADWLRGPLAGWADDLLDTRPLGAGLLDPDIVGAWWREHRSGRRDRHQVLWNVLMLQAWCAENGL